MKDLVFRNPRIGPAIVKPLIEIDQQLLAQQKGQLEFQSKAMDLIAQGAAAVEAQPPEARAEAYGQWRNVLMQRGIPGVAQQLPEQYDPQRVAALGTQARTAKERIDQQREQHQLEINAYDKETERLKLGEVGIHSGAFRDTPYYKIRSPQNGCSVRAGALQGSRRTAPASGRAKHPCRGAVPGGARGGIKGLCHARQ